MEIKSRTIKILKNKKGMTLIETVITFIIAGILIASTGALIISGLNLYQDTAARNLNKQIGDSVLDIVRDQLQYSTYIEGMDFNGTLGPDEVETSYGAIFTSPDLNANGPGKLYIKRPGDNKVTDVFPGEGFYSGRTVGLSYVLSNPGEDLPFALTITVDVYNDNDVGFNRSTSVQLMNIPNDTSGDPLGILPGPGESFEWTNTMAVIYTPVE